VDEHFVHFVLAEDERDDQNTHRPSGRPERLAVLLSERML
jgi:hypothetical protein